MQVVLASKLDDREYFVIRFSNVSECSMRSALHGPAFWMQITDVRSWGWENVKFSASDREHSDLKILCEGFGFEIRRGDVGDAVAF